MEQQKKAAFLILEPKTALKFVKLLSENLGLKNGSVEYQINHIVYVPNNKYHECLEVGFEIAKFNKWDLSWINAYNEPRPIGYFSVMYCQLPPTRIADISWEMLDMPNYCPPDIKEYIEKLKRFLRWRDIKIKYDNKENAIEFFIETQFGEYELLKDSCRRFDYLTKNSPFTKTRFLEKDGKLIAEPKEEKSTMESYLEKSMFLDGLFRPDGANIAPKTDTSQDFKTGYKYRTSKYGIRNFESNFTEFNDTSSMVEGNFVVYEEKKYSYYFDDKTRKQIDISIQPFIMLDNGTFTTSISIENNEKIMVKTYIELVRNIVGYNFDGKSVRDGLFNNFEHKDCRGNLAINEYYQIIANRTRLLHYSESSDFFEVYELPERLVIEDGISKLEYPKVFDDVVFDKRDKDLKEINSILATRTNSKGIPLVKRMNNSK